MPPPPLRENDGVDIAGYLAVPPDVTARYNAAPSHKKQPVRVTGARKK